MRKYFFFYEKTRKFKKAFSDFKVLLLTCFFFSCFQLKTTMLVTNKRYVVKAFDMMPCHDLTFGPLKAFSIEFILIKRIYVYKNLVLR